MTFEYAAYLKILLLCGYTAAVKEYIDKALIEQDPLSDIILELSAVSGNDKVMLSVINEYLRKVDDTDIDYNKTVFNLVLSFLQTKYIEESMPMAEITALMRKIAFYTEHHFDEPWQTMYFMGDILDEVESGYLDKKDFERKFDAFINDGICFCISTVQTEESFCKRILRKIRNKK